jgi:hypothetical protein
MLGGQAKGAHKRPPACATTVREVLGKLGAILEVAAGTGYLPTGNPVPRIRKVDAEPGEEVQAVSPNELEELLEFGSIRWDERQPREPNGHWAKGDTFTGRDWVITLLAGRVGLRPAEIRLCSGDRTTAGR